MSPDSYDTFYIGSNALAVREGKILLGKRRNVFGDGHWALPGGHLEIGENMAGAAKRELEEETGLTAERFTFVGLVNSPRPDRSKHYAILGFLVEDVSGEPELREPDRCYEWGWFELDSLPDPMFIAHKKLIYLYRTGKFFSDTDT